MSDFLPVDINQVLGAKMNQRQTKRRKHFEFLFAQMPFWETWSDERAAPTDKDPNKTRTVNHCKQIPRRVRRDMARKRMQREMRVAPL